MKTWVKTILANQVNYCCTWAVQLKLQMDITMANKKKHKLGYTPCNFGYISTYTWNCTSKQ